MNKLSFIKVDSKEDPISTAWHNMEVADAHLDLSLFIGSSMGWLKVNPGKNFQDLEKELRERKFNTHLIAEKNPNIPNTVIKLPNVKDDIIEYKYQCIMSCRYPKDALTELLQHSTSYEENFEKLKYAGILCSPNPDTMNTNTGTSKIFNDEERTDMQRLTENEVKVRLDKISAEEFLRQLETDLSELYDDLTTPVIGMKNDGSPIFVFMSNGQIVSNYGFSITQTDKGASIQVLTLQK